MKSITIAAFIPPKMPASNIYRGTGPLSELRHIMPEVKVIYPPVVPDWDVLMQADIVFMMKTSSKEAVRILEMAKICGKPVWYDLDDDLFNIPLENEAHAYYSGQAPGYQDIPQNIRILLRNCDVVTVSTNNLGQQIGAISGRGCKVVPNALDDYMLKRLGTSSGPRKKLITWRGGSTHQRDLDEYMIQIMELADELKDWKWLFMGHAPYQLMESFPDRVFTAKQVAYFDYMEEFWAMGAAVHIVPLAKTAFNHSKSNIASLEGIYAGASPVIPAASMEWACGQYFGYETKDDFKKCVLNATRPPYDLGQSVRDNFIKQNRLLSKVNVMRKEIIEELVKA